MNNEESGSVLPASLAEPLQRFYTYLNNERVESSYPEKLPAAVKHYGFTSDEDGG